MGDAWQENGNQGPRAGHDEPVVVDNGKATVLFGKRHTVTTFGEGKGWIRADANPFFALFVRERDQDGETTFVQGWDLAAPKAVALIRITLKNQESLALTRIQDGDRKHLQMVSLTTSLERTEKTGRLKFKDNNKADDIKTVEGYEREDGTGTPIFVYKPEASSKNVEVAILLQPEYLLHQK